ncbi:ISLp1 [Stigmatella aurantiaca DW4/3-1]|uniref:ISLp1 n=1 Tax=Stigmatella aurantiaca (strain DW4/3-1) TaxID=378806 RepID=E3FWS8_STIAD|nr:ISLp1 [Stigmatella aurantiaca DW4/3-1]
MEKRRPKESEETPLKRYIEALVQVNAQDSEPVPGGVRIRQGVAEDRRVSIEDAEMRHGRKSKRKRFNGFKQHLSTLPGHAQESIRPAPPLCRAEPGDPRPPCGGERRGSTTSASRRSAGATLRDRPAKGAARALAMVGCESRRLRTFGPTAEIVPGARASLGDCGTSRAYAGEASSAHALRHRYR